MQYDQQLVAKIPLSAAVDPTVRTIGNTDWLGLNMKSTRALLVAAIVTAVIPTSDADEVPFVRGDANEDGFHDVSDPVFILLDLFVGNAGSRCDDALDANDDERVNVAAHKEGVAF